MSKAFEVMTKSLATCQPDDKAADVAATMLDRDIGNVLVVENGMLKGIVTDRDLALHAFKNNGEASQTPIKNLMTSDVITGEADWNLNKVAKTMAKYQIRRLPILQDGQLAGIISLGDLAMNDNQKSLVARSLKAISTPPETSRNGYSRAGTILGLSLAAITTSMLAWFTWNQSGREMRKQLADTRIYQSTQDAVNIARKKVDAAASSKRARELQKQIKANIKELSTQLPRIEYKPPKRKSFLFH